MKEKLKDFYEKNKRTIKTIGFISIGAVIGWICGGKIYNSGKQEGVDLGVDAVEVLMNKAIEKNPDITIKEFGNQEFIDSLIEEIIESHN